MLGCLQQGSSGTQTPAEHVHDESQTKLSAATPLTLLYPVACQPSPLGVTTTTYRAAP
jgi:hypothetical protein